MMRYLILLGLMLMAVWRMDAQGDIVGQILELDDSPLGYANVVLFAAVDSSLVRGSISDEQGGFELQNIAAGQYFLEASLLGYQSQTSPVFSWPNNGGQSFVFRLSTGSTTLEEITVKAEKPLFEQKADRTIINVENSIIATGSTVLSILEGSPGVEVDRMNNQISLQGKQGVVVMLDGKMMRMEAAGLIQLLESLPSDNIASIELITTPPASFDAEGDAGIIQIITKGRKVEGTYVSMSLHAGYGSRPKAGGSFNINIRKHKLNLFADLSANINRTQENTNIVRQNSFGSVLTRTELASTRPPTKDLYNYRLGMDYELSQASTLGVLLSGYWTHWNMHATTDALITDSEGNGFSSLLRGYEVNNWRHWMVNLNYRHQFSEQSSLSIDLDYLSFFDDNPTEYVETNTDLVSQEVTERQFFSRKETPVDFRVAKLDYQKTYSEQWGIEVGAKTSISTFINDVGLEDLIDGNLVQDPRFTDLYELDENLSALYASVDFKANSQLSAKLGLRFEHFDSQLNSNQEGNILTQSYGRLFPTASLTYQPNEAKQFTLSYSERISRPAINNIAPAFYFFGYNTLLGGNPGVRPSISKQINSSFRYKTVILSFQFSDDQLPIIFQPTIFAEDNLLVQRAENMLDRQLASLTLNFPINFNENWESRYNFIGYWMQMRPIVEGQILRTSSYFLSANGSHTLKLPNDLSLELSGQVRTGLQWGLADVPINGSINLGIKKSLNSNSHLTLNWTDVLNTGSFFAVNYQEPSLNIFYDWHYDMEGSIIRLSFSHNFGNSKIKAKENRNTGSEEERGRMN